MIELRGPDGDETNKLMENEMVTALNGTKQIRDNTPSKETRWYLREE